MIRKVITAGQSLARFPFTSIGIINAAAAADDATLTVSERNFQSVKALANAVYYVVPASISTLLARFLLTTPDADVDIEIWVGTLKKDPGKDSTIDCDLQKIAVLDVICGTQDVYGTAKHYADTATDSEDLSFGGIVVKTAANHMAVLQIPVEGWNVIVFHGCNIAASGFDEDCEIELAGYA